MERSIELTRHITSIEEHAALFEMPKIVESLRQRVAQIEGVRGRPSLNYAWFYHLLTGDQAYNLYLDRTCAGVVGHERFSWTVAITMAVVQTTVTTMGTVTGIRVMAHWLSFLVLMITTTVMIMARSRS